jgi:hypothetical protein
MLEGQRLFDIEFDAAPPPVLDFDHHGPVEPVWRVDLDRPGDEPPAPDRRAQAFTLWLTAEHFDRRRDDAAALVRRVLADNSFTTLQVVLEPRAAQAGIGPELLQELMAACQERPTYLDKYYALQPGGLNGAKRLIVLLPGEWRRGAPAAWVESLGEWATVAWRGAAQGAEMEAYEYAWAP